MKEIHFFADRKGEYRLDNTDFFDFINGDSYQFYSDPIACSNVITSKIEQLSDMVANFTKIKDQLINGRV